MAKRVKRSAGRTPPKSSTTQRIFQLLGALIVLSMIILPLTYATGSRSPRATATPLPEPSPTATYRPLPTATLPPTLTPQVELAPTPEGSE